MFGKLLRRISSSSLPKTRIGQHVDFELESTCQDEIRRARAVNSGICILYLPSVPANQITVRNGLVILRTIRNGYRRPIMRPHAKSAIKNYGGLQDGLQNKLLERLLVDVREFEIGLRTYQACIYLMKYDLPISAWMLPKLDTSAC